MANAKKTPAAPKQFEHQPGHGSLHDSKIIGQTARIWEGNVTLPSGQKTRMQAIAIADPKNGNYYTVKTMNVDEKIGVKWETVKDASFTMPAFGDKRVKFTKTPIGVIRFQRVMPTDTKDAFIRVRFIHDAKGKSTQPVPL
jgi:hypothetical protein